MSLIADCTFETVQDVGAEGDVSVIIAGPLKEICGQFMNGTEVESTNGTEVEVATRVRSEWETWVTRDDANNTIFKALRRTEIGRTDDGEEIRVLLIHKEGVIQGEAAHPCQSNGQVFGPENIHFHVHAS